MSDTVIKVENLSKKYFLNHQKQERYTALRDVIANGVKQIGKKMFSPFTSQPSPIADSIEEFYALRDVSFEIRRGDRVGIIGRNGAGKSTLLKVLSRITEPNSGRIEITGRVACLLEVGTGFHPELTGRENIYLNGAILGMGRAEIRRKFDEIVDFAEVEQFLDTPVKRYSSGMYVRLAFAVAAHMEPEILIVDEVLAVGDAQFQKKCLGKMEDVGKQGKTVLFVSHNMGVISNLCNTGFILEKGRLESSGTTEDMVKHYELMTLQSFSGNSVSPGTIFSNLTFNSDEFEVVEISLVDDRENPAYQIKTFDNITFRFKFNSPKIQKNGSVGLFLQTLSGITVLRMATRPDSCTDIDFEQGINTVLCKVRNLPLPAGTYLLGFGLAIPMREWLLLNKELCTFSVERNDIFNSGWPPLQEHALSVVDYTWEIIT